MKHEANIPELISFADMCAALKISRTKAERMVRDESCDFPRPFKLGGERVYRADDVRRWIETKAEQANAA